MHFGISVLALASVVSMVACGGNDPVAPSQSRTVDVELLVEHWILDDPEFERESYWIFEWVAVGNYPIDYTLKKHTIGRVGIPKSGEILIPLQVQCDLDGTLPSWSITFEGTWTEVGSANLGCTWNPQELDDLPCADGQLLVSDFETTNCTPTAR